jgi:hypothetical protein
LEGLRIRSVAVYCEIAPHGDRTLSGERRRRIVAVPMLVAVTDHAAQRFRQRVRGTLDEKTEIASRVAQAHAAGRVQAGERGVVLVRDIKRRDLVFVCRPEGRELIVVTLWEEGEDAAVPRRFTDALRRDDHRVGDVARDNEADH